MYVSKTYLVLCAAVLLAQSASGWWIRYNRKPKPPPCHKVDCSLGSWSSWSICKARCGQHGTVVRQRSVLRQAQCGGTPCQGSNRQHKSCVGKCRPTSAASDPKCAALGGKCAVNTNYCSGGYASGVCHGASNRQCCVPRSQCSVTRVTNSYFSGDALYVENGFKSSVTKLGGYAKDCKVMVYVTHSWRKMNAKIGNTVVTPSSKSNHLVGHAFDFNLFRKGHGWCNSVCMKKNYNSADSKNPFRCFLRKVTASGSGLRWGGTWSRPDPVHIDDHYNKDHNRYLQMRKKLQAACKHIPMS